MSVRYTYRKSRKADRHAGEFARLGVDEADFSSDQTRYHGVLHFRPSCYSVQRIITYTRSIYVIWNHQTRSTKVTSEVSWAVTGVSSSTIVGDPSSQTGPTGEGFVSGSYDRTVRLWDRDSGKSRDVYHTKRMQR